MKIKLYILHSDTSQNGITLEVYPTQQKRRVRLRQIIEENINAISSRKTVAQIREHLAARRIDRAWELWRNNYNADDNYYTRMDEEVEVPASVKIEVLGGVAEVTRCTPGIQVTLQDHDNH